MADIELVIKMPEKVWNTAKEYGHLDICGIELSERVMNGTPLPKGHGRLIDADVLGEKLNKYTEAPYQYALAAFNDAPTIIDADKEND